MRLAAILGLLPTLVLAQSNSTMADYWERQKRHAMERMDAAAQDKSQCRTTYKTSTGIAACESSAQKWHSYWNERYIEATREYEKVR